VLWLAAQGSLPVQIFLGIVESIVGSVILAGLIWLGHRVKSYVDTLNRLSAQVAQLESQLNAAQETMYPIDPNTYERTISDIHTGLRQSNDERTREYSELRNRVETLEQARNAL
jgi:hypothetical protein